MPIIRNADCRRTETPNAVMTTLASPTQGDATQSVWRVDMKAGQVGPPHAGDAEMVWTVLTGAARIELAGETLTVSAGDTVIMPADATRQVFADDKAGFTAIVCAPATARVYQPNATDDQVRAVVRAGSASVDRPGKLLPAWMA
ncbi:MAG: cupin domain-containing protein [Sciscionella sp.]|nr:cupin domain-containing protein [Sciscionella sp.]